MRTNMGTSWIVFAVATMGCGGGALEVASGGRVTSPSEPPRVEATSDVGGAAGPSPASAAEAAPSARKASGDEAWGGPSLRKERSGLGTEWGETRTSRVHDVRFSRANGDRPFVVATLHYDDREGVARTSRGPADFAAELDVADGAVSVGLRGEDGDPLDARRAGDRTYVVGREGQRYSIVVTNHTNHRFEAVATVDGLDVVNGRTGSLANRGYVLPAFGSVTIDGFRQSRDAVAAFRFSRVAESYAARTGSDRNVGVIGVAFFSERGDDFDPLRDRESALRDRAEPFPADPRFARPPR